MHADPLANQAFQVELLSFHLLGRLSERVQRVPLGREGGNGKVASIPNLDCRMGQERLVSRGE